MHFVSHRVSTKKKTDPRQRESSGRRNGVAKDDLSLFFQCARHSSAELNPGVDRVLLDVLQSHRWMDGIKQTNKQANKVGVCV